MLIKTFGLPLNLTTDYVGGWQDLNIGAAHPSRWSYVLDWSTGIATSYDASITIEGRNDVSGHPVTLGTGTIDGATGTLFKSFDYPVQQVRTKIDLNDLVSAVINSINIITDK